MKIMKCDFFYNAKGSIVSSLVALSVITTSAIGLFQYMSHFRTSVTYVEQAGGQPVLMNTILNNLKSLLIESQTEKYDNTQLSTSTKYVYGICSLIKPVKGDKYSDELLIGFSNIEADSTNWGVDRWKAFFPLSEWEIIDGTECRDALNEDAPLAEDTQGSFKRCVKKIQTENNADTFIAIAEIIPEKINRSENQENPIHLNSQDPLSDPDDPSSPRGYDPKSIIFRLKVQTVYQSPGIEGTSHLMSYRESILWANDAGRCHVETTNDGWKIVQFSGSSTGTTSENHIINNSLTQEQKQCRNHINIGELNPDIVQVGAFLKDYGSIGSIAAVGASCTTNVFRCKQPASTDFDDLKMSFRINNKSGGEKRIDKLKLTFGTLNSKGQLVETDKTPNGELDGANIQFELSADQHESNSKVPFQSPRELERGDHSFTVKLEPGDIRSLCSEICDHYEPDKTQTYYYPQLDIDAEGETQQCPFQSHWTMNPNNRIRCTICHMKACHRKGLGTFGPYKSEEIGINVNYENTLPQSEAARYVNGLPEEPLDGQIPECKVTNEYNNNDEIAELPKNININPGNNCIALKSWPSTNPGDFKNHNYTTANCNDPKPVLCFVNGHYLPALRAPQAGEQLEQALSPAESSFKEAAKICYEIGKEIGNALELYTEITKFYTLSDTDSTAQAKAFNTITRLPGAANFVKSTTPPELNRDTKYEIINNATRGLFLAPPNYEVNYNIGNNISKQNIQTLINLISGKDVWVGLELDGGGFAVSSPPSAMIAKNNPYAIFFNRESSVNNRITILEDTHSPSNSQYLALGYNIRWKGLIPTNDTESLPFVCTDKERKKFFLTKNTVNNSTPQEGHEKCKAENSDWIFAPPVSALDWTKIMLELNPNDSHYPFPDPEIGADLPNQDSYIYKKDVPIQKAWVALHDPEEKMGGNEHSGIAHLLRLPLPSNTDNIFTNSSANEIIEKIRNNHGVIKIKHSEKSLNFHSSLLVQNITTLGDPKNPSDPLLTFSSLNTKTTPKSYQVCLAEKALHQKPLPDEIQNINGNCQKQLDKTTFKPTSYVLMSHLMELIMDKGGSDNEYLLVTDPEAFKDSLSYQENREKFRRANLVMMAACSEYIKAKNKRCPAPCPPPGTGMCSEPCPDYNKMREQKTKYGNTRQLADAAKKVANEITKKYNNPTLTPIDTPLYKCSDPGIE